MTLNTGGAATGLIVDKGDVGIGTTSPETKLDVRGGIRMGNYAIKPTCNASKIGTIVFDTVNDKSYVCASTGWNPSGSAALPLAPVTMKPMASLISSLLNTILAFAAGMGILFLIIGGIRYIRSWGDSDQMEKAKNTILYVVIGLVVILVSYSVIATLDTIING